MSKAALLKCQLSSSVLPQPEVTGRDKTQLIHQLCQAASLPQKRRKGQKANQRKKKSVCLNQAIREVFARDPPGHRESRGSVWGPQPAWGKKTAPLGRRLLVTRGLGPQASQVPTPSATSAAPGQTLSPLQTLGELGALGHGHFQARSHKAGRLHTEDLSRPPL